MKVKDYHYETFPSYDQEIEGMIELKGNKDNLRCRMIDIPYQEDCIIRLLYPHTILDEQRQYPLVIHVQGSGWYPQDMNDHIFDFMPIVKAGFVYAIVQYHGAPQSHFPTQIIDVKKAIRYLNEHYEHYPIDINNVFLSGDSSGGHVALMTLFTYESHIFDDSHKPLIPLKGVIDLYGIVDFLTFNEWWSKYDWFEKSNLKDFLGKDFNEEILKEASPITYLKEHMHLPPILILHGSKDHVVPFTQSVELYQRLKQYGYSATIARVKDADHGRNIFYVKDVYSLIINFLKQHTKNS